MPLVKALNYLCCACMWLLEKCIKYMTKNAYIQIALTNKSFCPAAWNAFTLMIKHAPRFGLGNSIGAIFMVLGCAIITAGSCTCSYLFLTNEPQLLNLTSPITPTIVVGVIALLISYQLMSVFSFSSDAIL